MKAILAGMLLVLSVTAAGAAPKASSDFAASFFQQQMRDGN